MLKSINNIYILISILFYIILSPKISGEYLLINFLSIFSFFTYYIVLNINFNQNGKFYKRKILMIEVLLYSLVFIVLNNITSYFYESDFFIFNKADALFYHEHTIRMLDMPIGKAIDYYLSYMGTDDLGMILVLFPLYHISESNLILNAFYLLIGILTALSIFNISKNFMSHKYAFLASLSYSLASFTIYFQSIGLKESFMIALLVFSFDFYYRFVKSKNIIHLIISLSFIASLLLFRPAVSAMILVSIGISSLLSKKGTLFIKVISLFIVLGVIANAHLIASIVEGYMHGGFEWLIYSRELEGMIIGSITFTYVVNTLSQIIGPLPTIISSNKIMLTFYASGLVYRILLAFPFWIGAIYIFKTKAYKVYPLIVFVLFEIIALTLLIEGLELRKALPHMPIVFIIAFWFLDKYDNKIMVFKRSKRFKLFFKFSMFLLAIIILFWNFK